MKHLLYKHFEITMICLFVVVLCIAVTCVTWQIRISLITGIISFAYFVQKHKLEELHLFTKLFKEFNERYDNLNEKLNRIILSDSKLSPEDRDTLFNYFNLCGEEYLYYKEGYILPIVWKAWKNGMKIFFSNEKVKDLWYKERPTDSYYGFEPF